MNIEELKINGWYHPLDKEGNINTNYIEYYKDEIWFVDEVEVIEKMSLKEFLDFIIEKAISETEYYNKN